MERFQKFAAEAFERAAKTAAQVTLAGMALVRTADGTGRFSDVNWPLVGDMVLYSVILSFVASVISTAFNDVDSPSLVKK